MRKKIIKGYKNKGERMMGQKLKPFLKENLNLIMSACNIPSEFLKDKPNSVADICKDFERSILKNCLLNNKERGE